DACAYYYLSAGYAYHYLFGPSAATEEDVQPVKAESPPSPPTEAFDPRFRLACDLYNAGLAKCIAAAHRNGKLDSRDRLLLPAREGGEPITLRVVHRGFRFRADEFGPLQLCSDYQVVGLPNQHRTFGLGVPLIAGRDPGAPLPAGGFYPPNVSFPATAFF